MKRSIMRDNGSIAGKKDALHVALNDALEMEYLHQQCTDSSYRDIKEAIRRVGPLRADVIDYLQQRPAY